MDRSNIDSEILFADQDSVRLLAVEGCAALGKLLEPADCVANVLPVIVSFSQVGYSQAIFSITWSFPLLHSYITTMMTTMFQQVIFQTKTLESHSSHKSAFASSEIMCRDHFLFLTKPNLLRFLSLHQH